MLRIGPALILVSLINSTGKIYIAGGFNGTQVLESAECYNPTTDEWTLIGRMNSPRSGVKMVAFRTHIYVIGGFNGSNRLSTGEQSIPII